MISLSMLLNVMVPKICNEYLKDILFTDSIKRICVTSPQAD
jgi:hypothetical protein